MRKPESERVADILYLDWLRMGRGSEQLHAYLLKMGYPKPPAPKIYSEKFLRGQERAEAEHDRLERDHHDRLCPKMEELFPNG